MFRFLTLVIALALAGPATADRIRDSIVAQLRAQGFTEITVSRTLLGRTRVVAQSPTLNREIIFNPNTGLIMRDYSAPRSKNEERQTEISIIDPDKSNDEETGDTNADGSESGGGHGGDGGNGNGGGSDDGHGDDGHGGGGSGDGHGGDGSGDGGGGDGGDD